jgi:hypothetical protein
MKRLVLTFLSMAAVCTAVSATPAAALDTGTGATRDTAPVTVEGYGNFSGSRGPSGPAIGSALSGLASAIGSAFSVPASATAAHERCRDILDFNDAHARETVVCGP